MVETMLRPNGSIFRFRVERFTKRSCCNSTIGHEITSCVTIELEMFWCIYAQGVSNSG